MSQPENKTPWIQWTEENEATGEVADIFQRWRQANPDRERFPEILQCFSGSPEVLQGILNLSYPLQFTDGALTRAQKELIGTYVSALNQCVY